METSATSDAVELSKSHRQRGLLEQDLKQGSGETRYLKEENKVLRRMTLREEVGDHARW